MEYLVLTPIFILLAFCFAIILLNIFVRSNRRYFAYMALAGLIASLLLVLDMAGLSFTSAMGLSLWSAPVTQPLEELKLKVDAFSLFFYVVFLMAGILVVIASISYIKKEERYRAEYFSLMLLAIVGMMIVASSTDLFVLYLAFELTSISTYALAAFRKKEKASAEAGLKFFLMGAVSSAIALFGISILYGATAFTFDGATTDLAAIGGRLAEAIRRFPNIHIPIVLGIILVIAGFGFKIAVVPFHMWAPDVYQGSPTTISAFLAAGSKKGGFAAFFKIFLVGLIVAKIDWAFIIGIWALIIGILAVITMILGNVLAIVQTDLKRMLAYSSIAQAGYVLIAVCVGSLAWDAGRADVAQMGVAGGLYHILVHVFMKGGAFLVVALTLMRKIGGNLNDYRGLWRRMPIIAFCMTILLLSLAGIPPLGGFFSKFVLFSSAVYAGGYFIWLAVFGVLNSALSLYYYVRVIKYMYVLKGKEENRVKSPMGLSIAVVLSTIAVIALGVFAEPIISFARLAASALLG
ncbi:MAG: NADH-quinone oxidoreductase subunit N [Thermoplasmata archaeon]